MLKLVIGSLQNFAVSVLLGKKKKNFFKACTLLYSISLYSTVLNDKAEEFNFRKKHWNLQTLTQYIVTPGKFYWKTAT